MKKSNINFLSKLSLNLVFATCVTGRMLGSWRDHRDPLFREDRDRGRFLERLGQSVEDFEGRLYLFCLMSGSH